MLPIRSYKKLPPTNGSNGVVRHPRVVQIVVTILLLSTGQSVKMEKRRESPKCSRATHTPRAAIAQGIQHDGRGAPILCQRQTNAILVS